MGKSRRVPIPAGALFTTTSGAYSDYCVHGVFRALVEIDTDTLLEQWLVKHPEQRKQHHFRSLAFFATITHMLEPVDCWELYLDSYGTAEELCTDPIIASIDPY